MDLIITQVYKYGTYYNPAWNHYKKPSNVVCDRCHKSNLKECIGYDAKTRVGCIGCVGYDTYDLCMSCIQTLSNLEHAPKNLKREDSNSSLSVGMKQRMFAISSKNLKCEDSDSGLSERKDSDSNLSDMN